MNAGQAAWGHLWTLLPSVTHQIPGRDAPRAEAWSCPLESDRGPIRLSGHWRRREGDFAAIVIHGLGGNADRPYCLRAARALDRRGWSCLRLELRGADLRGEDFYHAGLIEDLRAALASEELREFDRIAVLGYSLGGQLALRYACEEVDPRVLAIAAVCSPLDLARGADHLDRRAPAAYRRHLLQRLNATYAAVAARGEVPTPVEQVARVDSMREWDSLTVVRRHGFEDVDDYYHRASAGTHLSRLSVPSLLVVGRQDPMVRPADLEASLARASASLDVRTVSGGHVGFPPRTDLGLPGPRGVEAQAITWLEERLEGRLA